MNSTDFQDRFFDFVSVLTFREGLFLLDLFSLKPFIVEETNSVYVYSNHLSDEHLYGFEAFVRLLSEFVSDVDCVDAYKTDSTFASAYVHIFDRDVYANISQLIPVYLNKFGRLL